MSTLIQVFFAVFGVMDPVGNVPVFLTLTEKLSIQEKNRLATKAIVRASCILVIFVFFGTSVLQAFQISLNSLRIAGGIILTILGLEIVFDFHVGRDAHPEDDISVVPLAIPLIAGPGMITSSVILSREFGYIATLIAIALNLILQKIVFSYAHIVVKLLGKKGTMAFAKVMGLIVTAIGVEFIRNALK